MIVGNKVTDRAAGAVVGALIGDAIGLSDGHEIVELALQLQDFWRCPSSKNQSPVCLNSNASLLTEFILTVSRPVSSLIVKSTFLATVFCVLGGMLSHSKATA